jgi:hypothetical protein
MPGFQFGDIEADLIDYLSHCYEGLFGAHGFPLVDPYEVRNQVPDERSEPWPAHGRLVVVRDDGGWPDGLRATRSVGIRIFAPTREQCTDLAHDITAALNAWPNRIVKAGLSRPVSEDSGRVGRYLTASITERGKQI